MSLVDSHTNKNALNLGVDQLDSHRSVVNRCDTTNRALRARFAGVTIQMPKECEDRR